MARPVDCNHSLLFTASQGEKGRLKTVRQLKHLVRGELGNLGAPPPPHLCDCRG